MIRIRRTLALLLALCLLAVPFASARAQAAGSEYFPQTGHNLQGAFLDFYHAVPDPTTLYGYPITEAFTSRDGLQVQYFQRARFELHPERPDGGRVQLTAIGLALYSPAAPLAVFSPFACRDYPQTGYPVCFTFLDFYDKYGGPAQFGYPVSPFEYHDGIMVQYFEKARLEWQPSRPEGQRLVVSSLGRIYFERLGEDPGLLPPAPPLNAGIESPLIALRVHAFTWKATTLASDDQTIYVIVQDQLAKPVREAECSAAIQWPDGRTESWPVRTNAKGVASLPLSFSGQPAGDLVLVGLNCRVGEVTGSTVTSFRIWY